MRRFFPLTLAVLAGICGGTAAVNSCLDLSTGRCSAGSTSLRLYNCGLTNDDFDDLKACFSQIGEGNIETLSFTFEDFTALPADIFDGFGALTTLALLYTDLETLPAGIFDSLGALTSLEIGSNDLASLPAGVFDPLEALTQLSLHRNKLETLPDGIFGSLRAMTNLYIGESSLTTLPEEILDPLEGLTTLTLSYTGMTTLPAGLFDSLGGLTELTMNDNAFTTLPAGLFDSLGGLTELNMNGNAFTSLPLGIFDSLKALTTLVLSHNGLTTLPAGIFDSLPSLTTLNLVGNSLETLPAGLFDSMTLLPEINLDHNDLETLPAGLFDSLTLVTSVGLRYNNLKELPAGLFDSLTLLRSLDIAGNNLKTLPAGIFDSLQALTTLDMDVNELETLPDGVFNSLAALTNLQLQYNALTTLPPGVFDALEALYYLYLTGNGLTTLPPGTFDSLESLNTLYLSYNDLRTLPAGIFDSLEALRYLWLGNNPDLKCLPAIPPSVTSIDVNELTNSCDCDFGDLADPCDDQGLKCTPGPSGYLCAVGCDPNQGNVQCEDDQVCCDDREVCVDFDDADLYDPTACGDPHMTGFLGQKFDFTGEDGAWYSLIADNNMHVNMRVTAPVPDLPEITYITGLSVLITDAGGVEHSIVVEVRDPHNLDSSCPGGVSPCLADGSLSVILDGEETLLAPGIVSLSSDVEIAAANLPGACRSFGFEKYWERKQLENARRGRRLTESISMGEWILGDPTATNMEECMEYVARAEAAEGGVFAHQSEHASFQIVTPKATVRLSHGRLHQTAMRDPTDQFDLPEHLTWQMNMAIDHNEVSRDAKGILGETFVPTRDATGNPIMAGIEAIRGQQDDYRVEGSLGMGFVQDGHH